MCAVGECRAVLKYCGNTTNLASHLRTQHPLVYSKSPMAKKKLVADHNKSELASSSQTSSDQPRIKDAFQMLTKLPASSKRARELTAAVAYFIGKDMQPISVVQGIGFQDMVRHFEPRYQIPHRTTFMGRELPHLFQKTKEKVTAITSAADNFALTTDCWTSRANEVYTGVTFHTITCDWDLHHVTLENEELAEAHTADNLAEALKDVLDRWNLDSSNLSAITTDNASNIQKAVVDILHWKSLGCFGHTVNLCVKAGLKQQQVHTAVSRCARLVSYFRKSSRATHILTEKQEALGVKKHKLLQDVETRWNSTFDMVSRVIEQQAPICATLLDQKRMDLLPKDSEFKLLEELIVVLKPFKDVTEQMSAQKYVTISAVRPLLHYLLNDVLKLSDEDSSESIAIIRMKSEMSKNLGSRYQTSVVLDLLNLACFTDPRFKTMPFLDEEETKQLQEDVLEQLMQQDPQEEEEITSNQNQESDEPPPKKAKTGLGKLLSGMYAKSSTQNKRSIREQAETEIRHYLEEESTDIDTNPLVWWKQYQSRFPRIAVLARKTLCIPATSTPSERLFSTAGDIINAKRARLDPENVSMLCFLAENLP